jgi:hypothetical protein
LPKDRRNHRLALLIDQNTAEGGAVSRALAEGHLQQGAGRTDAVLSPSAPRRLLLGVRCFVGAQLGQEDCLVDPVYDAIRRDSGVNQQVDDVGRGHVVNVFDVLLLESGLVLHSETVEAVERHP